MPFPATVLRVLIASPSDTQDERDLLRQVIREWNDDHTEDTGTVLLPVLWETHSLPEMGDRPQAILNRQLVEKCDILVGAFWTRLGTPTGEEPSGTVEEIRKSVKDGKPVLLYFSDQPAAPSTVDTAQMDALRDFQEECRSEGVVFTYNSLDALERLASKHLNRLVRDRFGVAVPDQARPGAGAQVVARVEREQRGKTDSKGRYRESTHHFLVLENRGVADAHEVQLRFLPGSGEDGDQNREPTVYIDGSVNHLLAGSEVRFRMSVTMGTRPQFDIETSWREDGSDQRKTLTQTLTI
jgi:hypothetical protein